MPTEERRGRILEMVRSQGFASLPDLARRFDVSDSTVRRDLDHLEESGAVKRTHGGVFYTGPKPQISHFKQRQDKQWERKRQIARCAAELIENGETILLDGGSTTYELAQLLVNRPLQVVTNSLPVANLFTASDAADLVFIGGYIHPRTGVSIGPYANEMLSQLHVRHSVLSVAGVTQAGLFNSNLLLVETEKQMMAAADEVIVVADSTKFGRSSLARLCGFDEVDRIVVDDQLTSEWAAQLQQSQVHLTIADPVAEEVTENQSPT